MTYEKAVIFVIYTQTYTHIIFLNERIYKVHTDLKYMF